LTVQRGAVYFFAAEESESQARFGYKRVSALIWRKKRRRKPWRRGGGGVMFSFLSLDDG